MAEDNLLGRIRRVGYAVLPLLDSAELETARAAAEALAAPTLADPSNNPWNRLPVRTSATDGIEYTEHVPRVASLCDGSAAAVSLQRVVADARLRGFAAAALGADAVILDNIQLSARAEPFRTLLHSHRHSTPLSVRQWRRRRASSTGRATTET